MKKLLFSIVGALGVAACFHPIPPVPSLGEVTLPVVGEEAVWTSTDYKGRPVFMIFMGSWCPYCKMTMPAITAAAQEFGDQVEIVGVFMDDDADEVAAVAKEHGLNVKALYRGGEVAQSLNVNGLPHAIVFDKKHRVIKTWEGFKPTLEEEYKEALGKVVK